MAETRRRASRHARVEPNLHFRSWFRTVRHAEPSRSILTARTGGAPPADGAPHQPARSTMAIAPGEIADDSTAICYDCRGGRHRSGADGAGKDAIRTGRWQPQSRRSATELQPVRQD